MIYESMRQYLSITVVDGESHNGSNIDYARRIQIQEMRVVIKRKILRRAIGPTKIPIEVLKSTQCMHFMADKTIQ